MHFKSISGAKSILELYTTGDRVLFEFLVEAVMRFKALVDVCA